ncbi:hypothetical protein VCHA50P417_20441 [Vibrio chagasii]|nr:hypothetical protein VCHA35O135_100093 [Vibrio chagasii]CAH6828683.1 hypothetical protein VCHA32O87_160006 [Vibrio chagasii]CAH6847882.1 hypothetical protein VCHA36P161_10145 [Vibrio chagasii]CAH6860864.1 hypothetical protein VCHA28FP16_10777 [Vibrio chagasii]CAH6900783.1 hypothetical protein VCHA35P150_20396 [Vibrio chagasii]
MIRVSIYPIYLYIHLLFSKDLGDYEFDPQKCTSGLDELGS